MTKSEILRMVKEIITRLIVYSIILIDDPKAIQQINLTGNPDRQQNAMQHCFSFLKKRNKPF